MKSKKYIELEEKFIRLQNIYKVTMKKYFNLVEERKRHNILIEQQKEKIKSLENNVKKLELERNEIRRKLEEYWRREYESNSNIR